MQYAVIIERAGSGFVAYLPDIADCVASGDTVEEILELLRSALAGHFALLAEAGEAIPRPLSRVTYVDVPLPAPPGR